jgi:zinc/manganese transport system permease protein
MTAAVSQVFAPGLFTLPFMVHAWVAASLVAVASSLVGFFVIVRGSAFTAHAVPRAAFAGAAAAFLIGTSTLLGLAVCAFAMALALAVLDRGQGERGVLTALLLVAALGLGDLLLTVAGAYQPAVYALLFGQVVGISAGQVVQIAALSALAVAAFAFLYRPLLMITAVPETAQARGVPETGMRLAFLALVALTAALTVPVVGALLAFSLMVAPAAAASRIARTPARALAWSVGIALGTVWVALVIAYDTGLPIGFAVSSLGTLAYAGARLASARTPAQHHHDTQHAVAAPAQVAAGR